MITATVTNLKLSMRLSKLVAFVRVSLLDFSIVDMRISRITLCFTNTTLKEMTVGSQRVSETHVSNETKLLDQIGKTQVHSSLVVAAQGSYSAALFKIATQ